MYMMVHQYTILKYKSSASLNTDCAKHCSMCYNETECYECTQGYYLTENSECESK